MAQLAHDHEDSATRGKPRRLGILLAAGLLVVAGALFGTMPARADDGTGTGGGPGGGETRADGTASDHDGIYQVQRGEVVCESREACGPNAIPMGQTGEWYRPNGLARGR
jgi:hypothetical protein